MGPGTSGKPSALDTQENGHSTEPVAPVTPALKALEEENRRLKEVVATISLDCILLPLKVCLTVIGRWLSSRLNVYLSCVIYRLPRNTS